MERSQDHAVAPVVAVPVVELLEVIDIGVAECESPAVRHPASDVSLDLVGSGEAGGRMHGHVPGRPAEQNVQANRLLVIGQLLVKDLVRSGLEAPRGQVVGARAHEEGDGNDGQERILLDALADRQRGGPVAPGVQEHARREAPVRSDEHLLRRRQAHEIQAVGGGELPEESEGLVLPTVEEEEALCRRHSWGSGQWGETGLTLSMGRAEVKRLRSWQWVQPTPYARATRRKSTRLASFSVRTIRTRTRSPRRSWRFERFPTRAYSSGRNM